MNQPNNNKNCCGRLPNGQGWGHSGSCEDQTNNRIREEWKEKFDKKIGRYISAFVASKTKDFIAELLKSQREELVEKIEHQFYGANNPKVIDIINLIKEE